MTTRATCILCSAVLLGSGACPGETAGPQDATVDPSTSGSPTSFPPTGGADEPTTTTTSSTGSSTGSEPGTAGGPTDGSSGGSTDGAVCGNSIVEPGEVCDHGLANDAYAACTDECLLNVCGDGMVHVGVEECDEGPANVDTGYCRADCRLNVCGDGFVLAGLEECDGFDNGEVYGGCDEQCTVNRCGDGTIDAGHEQCDDAELNGSGEPGEDGLAGCGLDCGFMGRRIFVSSKLFPGNMGGPAGADLACRNMAAEVGLAQPQTYRAVLGSAQGSPLLMFQGADDLPVITPSGVVLAPSVAALVDLGPEHGIVAAETGEMLLEKRTWTDLDVAGGVLSTDPAKTCEGWTSSDSAESAPVGLNAVEPEGFVEWRAGRHWLSYEEKYCALKNRIYCMQLD